MVCALKLGAAIGGVMLLAVPVVQLATEAVFKLFGI
jgi:hypothetical protein